MSNNQSPDISILVDAISSLEEAVVIYDGKGYLIHCNQAFRDLYQYSENEAVPGVHFQELGQIDLDRGNVAVGDEYGGGEAYLARKAAYRQSLDGSFIVKMKDGRWIKTTDRRLKSGGFVSIQTDITDIKKTELALVEKNESLETANRAKTLFFANMSHELRTPLNAIIGFSELVYHQIFGPLGNSKYQQYIHDIHRSGRHLLELINDVLDYSSLESGGRVFNLRPISLKATIDECLSMVETEAENRSIPLNVQLEQRPTGGDQCQFSTCFVMAEKRALIQVTLNLISNAIKYSNSGQTVQVYCEEVPATGEIALIVADQGRGMSESQLAAIGEPFVAQPNHEHVRPQSTGLGLAITKRLLDGMGGRMEFISEVGLGTEVRVVLPTATSIDG